MYQRRSFLVTMVLAMLVLGLIWGCASNKEENDPNAPSSGPCSLSIFDPLGGETYFSGTSEYILWDSENVGDLLKIELFKFRDINYDTTFRDTVIDNIDTMVVDFIDTTRADTTLAVLEEATSNDGSTGWTVTTGPAPTDTNYSIKITSLDNSECVSKSDWFTIIKTEDCEIFVLVPQESDVWDVGSAQTIEWGSEGTGGLVNIYLYKRIGGAPQYIYTIAQGEQDDGTYRWDVFSCHLGTGEDYKVYIADAANANCVGVSDYFTINDESPCQIDVTSPVFEEIWEMGEEYIIEWHANQLDDFVDIYLLPPGLSPILIGSEIPASDASYPWTVNPDLVNAGEGFLIYVVTTDDECCFGATAPFTITE